MGSTENKIGVDGVFIVEEGKQEEDNNYYLWKAV